MTSRIVLASRSPRRKEILEKLGLVFEIDPPEIDETPRERENPLSYVQRIAAAKADKVALRHEQQCVVIAADTTVALDGEIFGQPRDVDEARRMIQKLSKKSHSVHTAVSVRFDGKSANGFDTASVMMREVTPELLEWYLATGESMGKAGAYAVQGQGAALVAEVRGEIDTVIGLPVWLLTERLAKVGVKLRDLRELRADSD
ncbi:MAG: septum formation protein Maf [Acidimicrobiia bacterium]|nr:septum formation protein Maf [Actinomycetota bacterium]NBY61769.1 septum formation protein Maf [Actinomycetota bacterium]NCU81633.1 septum formation protein Maf [Acidimicrobiia bacterium]NDC90835.1 septum formation protein Maf [Acidimicrobiia bacterium]NDD72568.1 septum formation protein Maf [Actinomycetota bacterium]